LPAAGVVLAFGDSLTAGTGADPGLSYPAQLGQLIGRRVINAGIPGELSAAGRARLPELLDRERPDLLLLCHGGNDLLHRTGESQAEANLRQMIEAAHSRGIAVVLIGVPRPGLLLDPAPFYRRLAAEFRLPLQEEVLAEILSDRDLKNDTVHPNAAGYRQLAEALAALLKKAGAL
jgi:lysophospholipase L1-like esterase